MTASMWVTRLSLAVVTICITGGGASAELFDHVLATVDGHVIMLSDVRGVERLGLESSIVSHGQTRTVLDELIDRELILAEVERYAPPEPAPEAVAAKVASVRDRFGSEAHLDAELDALGLDRSFVRQWFRNELRIAQYLDQRFAGVIEPTSDEIEAFRRQNPAAVADTQAMDDATAQRTVRERATAARREALVAEWIRGLRARAHISLTQPPSSD